MAWTREELSKKDQLMYSIKVMYMQGQVPRGLVALRSRKGI